MRSVNNSVETINAAATAIITAESRVQPATVQKRRWGGWWSLYWCFGSHKGKRISKAVLFPEPVTALGATSSSTQTLNPSTTVALPFIAPPSSPTSFLQSDPPSATQSPAGGLLSLTNLSVNAYSPRGPASIFTVGPYAYDTQLVSPPVFSTFTTEPSTAPFTPPPESVQFTTPPSPEVPFAKLLTSSLASTKRNSGTHPKLAFGYEFQSYQFYPGSPVGHLISPISNSGTSTPFPHKGEAPKQVGFENYSRWSSRMGSGSLTPDGTGPASRDGFYTENQISEVASLANSEHGSPSGDIVVDHRVSFELTGEDVARCLEKKPVAYFKPVTSEGITERDEISKKTDETAQEDSAERGEEEQYHRKGSIKEFNFDNIEGEVLNKSSMNSWTFFPMLQPGFS